jgi:hypothetical protein
VSNAGEKTGQDAVAGKIYEGKRSYCDFFVTIH